MKRSQDCDEAAALLRILFFRQFCQMRPPGASFYTAATTEGPERAFHPTSRRQMICVSVLTAKNVQPADTDRVLVQMLRDGNDRALEELLRSEGPKVLRLTLRLTGWHADAHDLCQEVFLAAWRHGRRMETDEALARWLTRVATNRCRSWHRRRALSERFFHWLQNDTSKQTRRGATDHIVDRDWVRHGLGLLKPRDREVLVLRYMEHLEINEIASVLGIKRAAVDARLTRARDRLSQILTEGEHPL